MRKSVLLAACIVALSALVMCFGCSAGGGSASSGSASSAAALSTAASSAAASNSAVSGSASASQASTASSSTKDLADGTYVAHVDTDSSMFHINESKDGTGELTVADGKMTVHMTLNSKRITNLYAGTAEQAKADPNGVIQPTNDKVTYSDGAEEEVYGFDVPVPALDEEFAVAILGEKGNWYDHKVTVSNPKKQ